MGALACASAVLALGLVPIIAGCGPRRALPHPDAAALADAGWANGLGRWEAVRAGAIALACVGTLLGLPLIAIAAAALAQSLWIRLRAEDARDRARRGLGRVVSTIEAALRSGISAPEALRRTLDVDVDPLTTKEISQALREFELGASLDLALERAASAARNEAARLALGTLAIGVAERMPRERLADLLAVIGDRLAFEEQLDQEVRARAAGARQQQRLLALLVPGMAAYLAVTMPTLAATLASDLGRFVLVPAAILLELAGIVLGRRIVRGAVR